MPLCGGVKRQVDQAIIFLRELGSRFPMFLRRVLISSSASQRSSVLSKKRRNQISSLCAHKKLIDIKHSTAKLSIQISKKRKILSGLRGNFAFYHFLSSLQCMKKLNKSLMRSHLFIHMVQCHKARNFNVSLPKLSIPTKYHEVFVTISRCFHFESEY